MKHLYQSSLDDYAVFHRDPRNKVTHYIGIPAIVFSIVLFLRLIQFGRVGSIPLDGAIVVMLPICIFYLLLNLGTGFGMTLILVLMYRLSFSLGPTIGIVLFVGGWALQFLGHYYEGKKPAFFKNGVHLLIGPLWILNDFYARLHLPAYAPKSA